MLQTLNQYDREKLEAEIIQVICSAPDYLNQVEILDSYFSGVHTRKYWQTIKELRETGKQISLINFAENYKVEEIKPFFEPTEWVGNKQFTQAVRLLEEDYKKHEISKILNHSKTSDEFFLSMERIRNIGTISNLKSITQQLPYYREKYEKRKEMMKNSGTTGLLFDWKKLAEKVKFEQGELVIVGAQTSIGKTAWSLDFAVQVAGYGQRVLFVTMEMSTATILDRIAANMTKTKLSTVRSANANFDYLERELKAIGDNFYLAFEPHATTETVTRLASKMHFDLIVVDYLQLLRDRAERGDNENYRIGRILKNLKRIAGENECVVLTPSQLNRNLEKRAGKPVLSDLRDSGNIEQDSDIILLLHREDRESRTADLIVAKNRNGEAEVEIKLNFTPAINTFIEM